MKKNIWLWNHYATEMFHNQGGRHYWFAKNLIKKGYKATIFCANTYHNKNEYMDTKNKKYTSNKIDDISFVFVKTTPALGNGIKRIKNMGQYYLNLFSVVKDYIDSNGKPDVIIASSPHPLTMIAGIQVAKKLGIPCICEIRDLWPEAIFSYSKRIKETSILGQILTRGEHWIYKKADALIFTKEGDTDYIKEKRWDTNQGGRIDLRKCHYINNGVDLDGFKRLSKEIQMEDEELNSSKFKVVYVGAIRPVNNIGNILNAAAILKEEHEIQFLIYGEGIEKEMLEKRVIKENLTNVTFKGFVNKHYVPFILSKSSLNLLNYSPTKYNWTRGNSSNKLFEYMASGKPIISTVKMGYSILDKYNCGIELESRSPIELAEAILKIKSMDKERYIKLKQNAQDGVRDFDFKILTEKLIKVIESVS